MSLHQSSTVAAHAAGGAPRVLLSEPRDGDDARAESCSEVCGTWVHPPAPSHCPIAALAPGEPLPLGGTRRHCQCAEWHLVFRSVPSVAFKRKP